MVDLVVTLILLAMSVTSWIVILWKTRLLLRVRKDMEYGLAGFWHASTLEEGLQKLHVLDREKVLLPLVACTQIDTQGTIAATGDRTQQRTRLLRDALHGVLSKLQSGQVGLASIGSIAPFVGLLGTVWGIYHALLGLASSGSNLSIDKVAGPVGEALIMTAAGLAVAIPAVLGYNLLGRIVARIEADLEGFAHDLRELP
ncbi:MAG: hypothetical protein RIR79_495 [Pseudomonadota bacterium]|jgi:biopolymer transport protein ExbB